MAAIEAGAPRILTLEYSSAAGMTYHSRDVRRGGAGRNPRKSWFPLPSRLSYVDCEWILVALKTMCPSIGEKYWIDGMEGQGAAHRRQRQGLADTKRVERHKQNVNKETGGVINSV